MVLYVSHPCENLLQLWLDSSPPRLTGKMMGLLPSKVVQKARAVQLLPLRPPLPLFQSKPAWASTEGKQGGRLAGISDGLRSGGTCKA